MASTITITCPECDKQMKASTEVLGKKIRCKGCGYVFPAKSGARSDAGASGKQASGKAKKGQPKKDEDDEEAKPYDITIEQLSRRCPQCANELEDEDAIVCLYCGYNTVTRTQSRMRKIRNVTGWDVFKHLLPGIGCVLAIMALIAFDLCYCLLIHKIDQDAWYAFLDSLGMKIWIVLPTIFMMYYAAKFAIRRLIYNYNPPEIEERL
jgi:hypothetical protein